MPSGRLTGSVVAGGVVMTIVPPAAERVTASGSSVAVKVFEHFHKDVSDGEAKDENDE